MNKTILTIALAATIAAPAAMAVPTVYGNLHFSINDFDNFVNGDTTKAAATDLDMTSNTSAIGVKGSEDLGDGLKAIYKMEFGVDAADTNAISGRDQWLGLKGGMGTVKIGTMSSNYKQKGGKVDSMYRTRLEGRGFLKTQSNLHGSRSTSRGRQTNTVQLSSNKYSGIQVVANTTFNNSADETLGFGIRWANKNISVFADTIDTKPQAGGGTGATETATKFGGSYKNKSMKVGAQMEMSEDVVGFDYLHVNASFKIDKNNSVSVTVGTATHITTAASDTDSVAVLFNHKLSKMTNVYVGYGDKSSDTAASEETALTAGIKKKF